MEIIAIAVTSLDGFITKHDEPGTAFASAADQQFFREALREFDCQIFGAKTFEVSQAVILRNLTPAHLRIVLTRSPERYAAYQQPGRLEFTDAAPEAVIAMLKQRNKRRCALLGGSAIYTLFLAWNLVDELWITVEPRLFGAGQKLITGPVDRPLHLKNITKLSEHTLLLQYALPFSVHNE
jgi:dihydrofolate reductase